MKEDVSYKKQISLYMLMILAVTAALTVVSVVKAQGIFFPTDEFGYWSIAGRITDKDNPAFLNSSNSYAPGYGVLLAPLMLLFQSPVGMYRAAIVVNAILMLAASFLFIRLIHLVCGRVDGTVIPCILFPPYLVYMGYTISEVLLYVLFLLLCCIMVRVSADGGNKKYIIAGSIVSLLMTVTHYRAAGISVICVAVCLLNYAVNNGKAVSSKCIAVISVAIFVILIAAMLIYSNTGGRISSKEYGVDFVIDFIIGAAGKVFYVGASTFGIGLVGLTEVYRKRREPFFLFILLSFLYMVLLSSFYFCGGTRLDQPVYGRYGEIFIPLLIYIGLKKIGAGEVETTIGIITFMGASALLLTLYVNHYGKSEYVADFINGIAWMFGTGMPRVSAVYIRPFIIASIGLYEADKVKTYKRMRRGCIACLALCFILISFFLTWMHVWHFQDIDRSDRVLAETAKEMAEDGREVIFLDSPCNDYINLLWFWLDGADMRLLEGLVPEAFNTPVDAVVITYMDYECDYQLRERYQNCMYSTHFNMYDNEGL